MIKLEHKMRKEIEMKKVNLVPLDLQGQLTELIREASAERCLSVGSNISVGEYYSRQATPTSQAMAGSSEETIGRSVEEQVTSVVAPTRSKRLPSIKRKMMALFRKRSQKQKKSNVSYPVEDIPSLSKPQPLRGTVSMSVIKTPTLTEDEMLRKHQSMPIGTTFTLYQEEKHRLIMENAKIISSRPSSSPPTPSQAVSATTNRKRDSNLSLLASISLRSLFRIEPHPRHISKHAGASNSDATEELSDILRAESPKRSDDFVAFRYPKMASLDDVEKVNNTIAANAHTQQATQPSMFHCVSSTPIHYQDLAALAVSY
ncbi:hypothetical protein INT43_003866 [Umbelopsis isabellina]|uniref:Uncharacterized protein n=1 Tax=Mortierella isabellina TaxID=91625 RepID=A0A8H7PV58_MORIS|nr:hypothetical protein INT43_003866 [Umbelopsis isabellina]